MSGTARGRESGCPSERSMSTFRRSATRRRAGLPLPVRAERRECRQGLPLRPADISRFWQRRDRHRFPNAVLIITLRNAATSGSVTLGQISYSMLEFLSTVAGCLPSARRLRPVQVARWGWLSGPAGRAGAAARVDGEVVDDKPRPLCRSLWSATRPRRRRRRRRAIIRACGGMRRRDPSRVGESISRIRATRSSATWFTFDFDGSPLWMVVAAPKIGPDAYAGTLYRGTGPAYSAAPFDPAQVAGIQAGTASFTFGDASNGTFAYTVGRRRANQVDHARNVRYTDADVHMGNEGRPRPRQPPITRTSGGRHRPYVPQTPVGESISRTRATRSSRRGSRSRPTASRCGG